MNKVLARFSGRRGGIFQAHNHSVLSNSDVEVEQPGTACACHVLGYFSSAAAANLYHGKIDMLQPRWRMRNEAFVRKGGIAV